MISPDLLEILRCPLDPSHTRVKPGDNELICERCALRFPIKDGFPVMVVEEATLPAGCDRIDDLPCQTSSARGGK